MKTSKNYWCLNDTKITPLLTVFSALCSDKKIYPNL